MGQFIRKPPTIVQPPNGVQSSKGLLLVLHGFFTQDGPIIEQQSGLNQVAANMGFTVCYPNALGRNWIERATLFPNIDVAYLEGLIHAFNLPVCYSLGFSDGACMLVSQPIQGISKVVCYAGNPIGQANVEGMPLWPLLVIHGADDWEVNQAKIDGCINSYKQAGHVVNYLPTTGGHEWNQAVNPAIQAFLQSP